MTVIRNMTKYIHAVAVFTIIDKDMDFSQTQEDVKHRYH